MRLEFLFFFLKQINTPNSNLSMMIFMLNLSRISNYCFQLFHAIIPSDCFLVRRAYKPSRRRSSKWLPICIQIGPECNYIKNLKYSKKKRITDNLLRNWPKNNKMQSCKAQNVSNTWPSHWKHTSIILPPSITTILSATLTVDNLDMHACETFQISFLNWQLE